MGASSKEHLFFINRQNIFTVNKNEKNHHLTVCHTLCHSNIRSTEISKMAPVDFASEQWFGEWLAKDQNVYGDITKSLNLITHLLK